MKVANNTYVTLTYTLHNDTKDGPVIDQATKEKPLEAIFGHGMFLPRFEECLQGLEPGDKYGFHLTPAEGYGEYNKDMVFTVKKDMFLDENGKLSELCKEGNTLQFNVGNGIMPGKIKKVSGGRLRRRLRSLWRQLRKWQLRWRLRRLQIKKRR